jgi:hypothetical protein
MTRSLAVTLTSLFTILLFLPVPPLPFIKLCLVHLPTYPANGYDLSGYTRSVCPVPWRVITVAAIFNGGYANY